MSQEIILRLPDDERHKTRLREKADSYLEKAEDATIKSMGTSEKKTLVSGELNTYDWSNETVAYSMVAREILQCLENEAVFRLSDVYKLEHYDFLLEKLGEQVLRIYVGRALTRLNVYVNPFYFSVLDRSFG